MTSFKELLARTRQGVLLGIAFVLLIVIAGMTIWLVEHSAPDAERVANTLRVKDELSDLLLNVRRAESGQRGYLFTQQESYLGDFAEARPEIDKHVAELRRLVQDNPARLAEIWHMMELIDAKFQEMSRTIELNKTGRRAEARRLVLGGTGRDLAVDLRKSVENSVADEGRLLNARAARSQSNNRLLLLISL